MPSNIQEKISSLRLEDEVMNPFLRACVEDVFSIKTGIKIVHSLVTTTGEVSVKESDKNIEIFLAGLPPDYYNYLGSNMRSTAQEIRNELLHHASKISFSMSSLDANQGEDKTFGRYHEPENFPKNKSQKWIDYKAAVISGAIGGAIPGAVGTAINIYQSVSSNLVSVNTPLQALIWGGGAIGAFLSVIVYTSRAANNPRKEFHRTRNILGKEIIIHDNDSLNKEDNDVKPFEGNYTGRILSYSVHSKNGNGIPVSEWAVRNDSLPLFSAVINDATPGDTISLARLGINIGGINLDLKKYEAFDYREKMLPISGEDGSHYVQSMVPMLDKSKITFRVN